MSASNPNEIKVYIPSSVEYDSDPDNPTFSIQPQNIGNYLEKQKEIDNDMHSFQHSMSLPTEQRSWNMNIITESAEDVIANMKRKFNMNKPTSFTGTAPTTLEAMLN